MERLANAVGDFCASEHFLLLDDDLKGQAESLLAHWCGSIGEDASVLEPVRAMEEVAGLDLPLSARRGFPQLLTAFLYYASDNAAVPEAEAWGEAIARAEGAYLDSFREDGTVRGQTVRHPVAAVGRNDPCPCGSGRKFKKCCMVR
ncbi:SEC-C metal-binding domain-containing protein [Candidatus Latescibacterota bacterium]